MTATQPHSDGGVTRRGVMRRAAIGVGAAAGASTYGLSGRGPGSPVGSADALAPIVVAGAAGGAVALGWALREFEIIGSDTVTDGLGPDALRTETYQIARTRSSTNQSTIVDNGNLADGITNTAYTDGKIAAIEKLNNETSLDTVQSAADAKASEYISTVMRNLLKTYNEAVQEFESLISSLESGTDTTVSDVFTPYVPDATLDNPGVDVGTSTETLPDGTTYEYKYIKATYDSFEWDSGSSSASGSFSGDFVNNYDPSDNLVGSGVGINVSHDGSSFVYLDMNPWGEIWEKLKDTESQVLGGLENWAATVYDEVQAGSIEISDLLTPRERAEMLSDDEEFPQAVADLVALNLPVDPDREATITLQDRDITLSGLMAPTSPPADGFVVGQTYDPPAESWDLYFTYQPSEGSGGWTDFETEISEGELVFTSEPYEASIFTVPTNAETVEVATSDFTDNGDGTWSADVSDQLSRVDEEWTDFETGIDGGTVTFTSLPTESAEFVITATDGDSETVTAAEFTEIDSTTYEVETGLGISEVDSVTARIDRWTIPDGESVSVSAEDGSAGYETIQIKEPFTLEKLEDSEGNTYGESEFSRTEPQDDTNYITQEEWNTLEERNQELIDKYEEATKDDSTLSGGGGGILTGDLFGDTKTLGIVAGGAALAALLFGNN